MKLPENIKIRITKEYFSNYMLSHSHYFGKFKIARLGLGELDESSIERLIINLMRIPIENNYIGLQVIYKIGFIYKVEYVTTVVLAQKQFYVKTIWAYESKTKLVQFINIEIIH